MKKLLIIIIMFLTAHSAYAVSFPIPFPHSIGVKFGAYRPLNDDYRVDSGYDAGYNVEIHGDLLIWMVDDTPTGYVTPYFDIRFFAGFLDSDGGSHAITDVTTSSYWGYMFMLSPPTPIIDVSIGFGVSYHEMDYEGVEFKKAKAYVAELSLGHTFESWKIDVFARYTGMIDEYPIEDSLTVGLSFTIGDHWKHYNEDPPKRASRKA